MIYTGATIAQAIDTYMDEVGSQYIDDTSKNIIMVKAVINVVDQKIEEFQSTQKVTREMQPLVSFTNALTPVNATVDMSQVSLIVPDYYSFLNLKVTSPYRGGSLVRYAEERKFDQFNNDFTAGTARYPRYYFTNGLLNIEPTDVTSIVMGYFKEPPVIDVTDTSTAIPFNQKLVNLIIAEFMNVAGVKGRDAWITQQSLVSEQKNP